MPVDDHTTVHGQFRMKAGFEEAVRDQSMYELLSKDGHIYDKAVVK